MVCLKRALQIAHAAQHQLAVAMLDTLPAALFVEILNPYLYCFDQGLTLISSTILQVSVNLACWRTYTSIYISHALGARLSSPALCNWICCLAPSMAHAGIASTPKAFKW